MKKAEPARRRPRLSNGAATRAAADVTKRLREQIQRGERTPGEWLREQKLCDEFKVGRTMVRTALRNLADDGLISLVKNRGGFVAQTTLQEVFDLFELRAGLYGVAARFTCIRGSAALIKDIVQKIDAMTTAAERGAAAKDVIAQSEDIFSLMAGTASLEAQKMMETVRRKTLWHYSYVGLGESPRGMSPFEHWSSIRAALLARDAAKASEGARNIIYYIQTRVSQLMLARGLGGQEPAEVSPAKRRAAPRDG